jgi:hypothetical protein
MRASTTILFSAQMLYVRIQLSIAPPRRAIGSWLGKPQLWLVGLEFYASIFVVEQKQVTLARRLQ